MRVPGVSDVVMHDEEESALCEVSKASLIDVQGWRRVPQVD